MGKILFILFLMIFTLALTLIFLSSFVNAQPSFVYVKDGHFYKDGKRINFYGTVDYANISTLTGWMQTNQKERELMVRSGLNLVRLWTTMGNIIPTYNQLDTNYLNNTLDVLVKSFSDLKIYIAWTVNAITMSGSFPNYTYPPLWLKSDSQYNETSILAYENVFGNLSQRYANEEYVLGYILPYNEWSLDINNIKTMTGSDWATGNITVMWNFWLKNEFGTIENLNNTWCVNDISCLNASEGEDHFLTEWGDNQSGGIRLPKSILEGGTIYGDYRLPEWRKFEMRWAANYTNRLINRIRKYDNNHIIFFADGGWKNPGDMYAYQSYMPEGIQALEPHSYFNYPTDNDHRLNDLASWIPRRHAPIHINSSYPFLVGEISRAHGGPPYIIDDPYPWLDNLIAQMYYDGVDAVTFFTWGPTLGDGHMMLTSFTDPELNEKWKSVLRWAEAFKNNNQEKKTDVLVIGDDLFLSQIGVQLAKHGVKFAQTGMVVGDVEPSILNQFKVIFVQATYYTSKQTLIKIREWAETGNGKVIIFLWNNVFWDEHGKTLTLSELGWDKWILKSLPWQQWTPTYPVDAKFNTNLGNITINEQISIEGSNPVRNLTASHLTSGATIIANYTQNEVNYVFIAKNATGNVYLVNNVLNTYPTHPSEGWRRIIYALLNDTGLIPMDETKEVLEVDNSANGYVAILEQLARYGNITTKFTSIDIEKSYAIYELNPHNNLTLLPSPNYLGIVSGSTLRNGWNIPINAYHSKLLRVINSSTPSYILVLNGSLVSENLTDKQLKVKVDSVPETNVSTSIYIPEGFYSNDNFAVRTNSSQYGYTWNPEKRILNIWTIH